MFREVRVYEIKEVLRLWVRGEGLRSIERLSSVDRKTVRRYVAAATEAGLDRSGSEEQLDDVLLAQVVEAVRPTAVTATAPPGRCWWPTTTSSRRGW